MYKRLGYYPVFYLCFAVLAVDLILRIFMLEKSQLRILRHKRALELSKHDPLPLSPNLVHYMNAYIAHTDDSEI